MADDPTSVPPENNRINVRNVSVQRSTVRDANFTRADIKTGEIKSVEGDILSEIAAAVDEQTATLVTVFEKEIRACCKAASGGKGGKGSKLGGSGVDKVLEEIKDGILGLGSQLGAAGGGEGGGGGAGGADTADLAGQARIRRIANVLDEVGFRVDEFGNTVFKLVPSMDEFENLMRENVNETVRKFGSNMTDILGKMTRWDTVSNDVMNRFNKTMEMSSSGMLDLTDAIGEDALKAITFGFSSAADSLIETAEQVRKAVDEGITSPMRLVQGNIKEVATEFKRLRGEAESFGLDLYARIGWREQNELLTALIDEQRRGSIQDDFRDFETKARAMEQLKFMTMVADNTGMSLEQLMAMNKEQAKTFEELQALGIITEDQAQRLKEMSQTAPPAVKDFLSKIAESGGSTAVFAQKFPDLFEDLTRLGQQDLVGKIAELSKSGLRGTELANALKNEMQGALGNVAGTFGSEAAAIMFQGREIQGLVGATNQMTAFQENMGAQSPFIRAWRKAADFFTNTWPVQTLASISALGFNTMAIIMNTAAHGGLSGMFGAATGRLGKIGGMLGRVLGLGGAAAGATGVADQFLKGSALENVGTTLGAGPDSGGSKTVSKGMFGKIGNLLKGAAKIGGSAVGGALVAKDVYDVATGDTSGENVGALIGSAIGGIGGFMLGGPAGAMAGAAVGNMAGEWIGGAMSAGEAVDKSTAPRSRDMARSGGAQQSVALQMTRQTEILNKIDMKLERSIAVQTEIASGVGKIGFESSKIAGVSKAARSGDTPVFASSYSQDT